MTDQSQCNILLQMSAEKDQKNQKGTPPPRIQYTPTENGTKPAGKTPKSNESVRK